jgi:hypothetical protein
MLSSFYNSVFFFLSSLLGALSRHHGKRRTPFFCHYTAFPAYSYHHFYFYHHLPFPVSSFQITTTTIPILHKQATDNGFPIFDHPRSLREIALEQPPLFTAAGG